MPSVYELRLFIFGVVARLHEYSNVVPQLSTNTAIGLDNNMYVEPKFTYY